MRITSLSCVLLITLFAGCMMSGTGGSSTGGGDSSLADLVRSIPTEESLRSLTTGGRLSRQTITDVGGVSTSNLNYEMDFTYSLLETNDIWKRILQEVTHTGQVGYAELGTMTVNGKTLSDVSVKFDLTGVVYHIHLKYTRDQYTRRYVVISISNYGETNETVSVSYFDKLVNPVPFDVMDYEYVNRCNFVYTKQGEQFRYFRLFSLRRGGDFEFRKYATLFLGYSEAGIRKFHRSNNDVYEDYNYMGQTYPEFIWETEREFAFLDPVTGYGGRAFGSKLGPHFYQFYDERFDLVHLYGQSVVEDHQSLRAYIWPVRFIASSNPNDVVLYGDVPWRVWIDANRDGIWNASEARLETDMEPLSQVFPGNTGLAKTIPFFMTSVSHTVPSDSVGFNYYDNPEFRAFRFTKNAFLQNYRSAIMTILNAGHAQHENYDPRNFPVAANPENIEW